MTTIEDFLHDQIAGDTGITAVVGSRIYRVKMPDNPVLPAITYHTAYGEMVESFQGYSGLKNPVMTVDCWAKTAGVAQDLAERVRLAIHGYGGTSGDRAIANVLDWSTTELYDGELEIFHVACSFRVWYS